MEALRLARIREQLVANDLEAILIASPFNRRYLTGFTGSSGYVLITGEKAQLFTDFRYVAQAADQAKAYEVVQHDTNPLHSIYHSMQTMGVKKVGFERNLVTYGTYLSYVEQFPGIELEPIENMVETLRGIKDEKEISHIRKAVEITEKAFEHILSILKPGISERDVSAELEYFMRMNGAASSAYPSIVASGVRSSLPHGLASDKLLGENEFVTLDFGASYEGYCSDLTRTVFIGTPTEEHKQLYAIVLEANRKTLAALKPGVSGKEGDSIARDYIASFGYGPNFGHGLGHAFGLEIHESVRFSQQSKDILAPGMVITVEPGIYIPGFGGVRIEDDIVVTETGIEVLTKSSKELIVL